jgi:hypothetical protein
VDAQAKYQSEVLWPLTTKGDFLVAAQQRVGRLGPPAAGQLAAGGLAVAAKIQLGKACA